MRDRNPRREKMYPQQIRLHLFRRQPCTCTVPPAAPESAAGLDSLRWTQGLSTLAVMSGEGTTLALKRDWPAGPHCDRHCPASEH